MKPELRGEKLYNPFQNARFILHKLGYISRNDRDRWRCSGGGDFAGAGVAAKRGKEDYEGREGGGVGRANKSIFDKLNKQRTPAVADSPCGWVCEICKLDGNFTNDKIFLNAFFY